MGSSFSKTTIIDAIFTDCEHAFIIGGHVRATLDPEKKEETDLDIVVANEDFILAGQRLEALGCDRFIGRYGDWIMPNERDVFARFVCPKSIQVDVIARSKYEPPSDIHHLILTKDGYDTFGDEYNTRDLINKMRRKEYTPIDQKACAKLVREGYKRVKD